jgi:hypothetical protein
LGPRLAWSNPRDHPLIAGDCGFRLLRPQCHELQPTLRQCWNRNHFVDLMYLLAAIALFGCEFNPECDLRMNAPARADKMNQIRGF